MARTASTPLYLGDELRARAEAAARRQGLSLSAWVREAISDRLAHDERRADGLAALAEWAAEEGPVPVEVARETREELEQAGCCRRVRRRERHVRRRRARRGDRGDARMRSRRSRAGRLAGRAGRRPPGARLARLLRGCTVEPADETLARGAGELLGRAGRVDGVDAVVVLSAARRGGIVYTSDPGDLTHLASHLPRTAALAVRAV